MAWLYAQIGAPDSAGWERIGFAGFTAILVGYLVRQNTVLSQELVKLIGDQAISQTTYAQAMENVSDAQKDIATSNGALAAALEHIARAMERGK